MRGIDQYMTKISSLYDAIVVIYGFIKLNTGGQLLRLSW